MTSRPSSRRATFAGLAFVLAMALPILCPRLAAQSPAVQAETALFIDRGQYDDAQRALNRGLAEQPNQPTYLTLQGLIHMKKGQYAKAEESFARARENSPANPMSALNLAETLYLRGRYAEALKEYRSVDKDAEFKPFAQYKEVLCLIKSGQSDEAVRLAKEIKPSEKDPASYYALAAINFHQGRRDQALYFVESARRLYGPEAEVFRFPLISLGWME
jgi:tetratricopeptide (TPR) repeat protein